MAESALAAASAATADPDIKQEREVTELEALNLALLPEVASKRPFEDIAATSETPEPKRTKVEKELYEASLEDDLALLVQNALSNVGDLVDQMTSGSDVPGNSPSDAMEVDTAVSPPETPESRPTFAAEPWKYVRDANVHALGNLALSMLLILVQTPFEDTIRLVRGTDSEHKRSFSHLRSSFEHVRQLFCSGSVLTADQLEVRDAESRTFIELANMAQLGSWLADGSPNALSDADKNFLALFQCQLSDLPTGMTELYLSIKTQRAIEFLAEKEPEKPSEEVIGEVLTQGLEDVLKEQHGGGELTSADQSFVSSVQTRKETLQGEVKGQIEPAALREKHPAEDLLRSYLAYAKSRLRTLTDLGDKLSVPIHLAEDVEPEPEHDSTAEATGDADLDLDDLSSFFEKTASGLVQNALAGLTDEAMTADASSAAATAPAGEGTSTGAANTESGSEGASTQTSGKIDPMTDYRELEALVAESTSNYVKTTLHGLSPVPYQPTVPASTAESMAAHLPHLAQLQHHQAQNPYHTYAHPHPEPQLAPAPGENLPPNQTFPSAILYDKARQAALSKSSAHTRREGLHSTRRPWTQEEEKALMAGLDMVKGPHWSQILTLFGQNGTISDILRDRTQVQLKDKARNLKLFFLKTNSEMPYYLQAVTGELKTRAPTQAARKEAEERARLNSEEDQAKLQGIMTLAGGLQNHTPRIAPAISAGGTGPAGTPPAQAAPPARHQVQVQGGHQNNAGGQNGGHTLVPRPAATPHAAPQTRPAPQANTQQLLNAVTQAHQQPLVAQSPPQIPRQQGPQPPGQEQPQPQRCGAEQQAPQAEPLKTSATPGPAMTNGQSLTGPDVGHQQAQSRSATQQQPTTPPAAESHTPGATATATAARPASPALALPTQPLQQPRAPAAMALMEPSSPTPAPAPAQQQGGARQARQPAVLPPRPPPPQIPPHPVIMTDLAIKTETPCKQEPDLHAEEASLLEGLQAVVAQTLAS